ncbi:MAG: methylmalonyl Co-A mutase-associated GTPase MeaB [Acidimicrobiales bacterium]
MRGHDPEALLASARAGDRAATGRLISLVERGGPLGHAVGRLTFPLAGAGMVVGITGAPGTGKSSLTDRLITRARAAGEVVGVVAVDPSSPISGGALLGDRVRMQGHAGDDGVFIRSMATRGHPGGLCLAVPEVVRVLAALGFSWVVIETVGVGQVEVEVAGAADTTVVVVNPGWGDAIQANKAGLLEVADIFVVNKADRPGAAEASRDLEHMLDLGPSGPAGPAGLGRAVDSAGGGGHHWRPPVVTTCAVAGEGSEELWEAVAGHRRWLEASGELEARRRRRLVDEMRRVVVRSMERDVASLAGEQRWAELSDEVAGRRLDPYSAAQALFAGLAMGDPRSG